MRAVRKAVTSRIVSGSPSKFSSHTSVQLAATHAMLAPILVVRKPSPSERETSAFPRPNPTTAPLHLSPASKCGLSTCALQAEALLQKVGLRIGVTPLQGRRCWDR